MSRKLSSSASIAVPVAASARGGAVAEEGREAEDGKMTHELAEQHLPAAHRVAQEQQQRAALHLADDGIMRDQERDQRAERS